ncbi:MAG TPA: hypothetical protein VFV92_07310 [Candidatus Bathyarchaeia archaeon]|nr:hypothetical protein [Candidatus Bathyarchaeia archaeon]
MKLVGGWNIESGIYFVETGILLSERLSQSRSTLSVYVREDRFSSSVRLGDHFSANSGDKNCSILDDKLVLE